MYRSSAVSCVVEVRALDAIAASNRQQPTNSAIRNPLAAGRIAWFVFIRVLDEAKVCVSRESKHNRCEREVQVSSKNGHASKTHQDTEPENGLAVMWSKREISCNFQLAGAFTPQNRAPGINRIAGTENARRLHSDSAFDRKEATL